MRTVFSFCLKFSLDGGGMKACAMPAEMTEDGIGRFPGGCFCMAAEYFRRGKQDGKKKSGKTGKEPRYVRDKEAFAGLR